LLKEWDFFLNVNPLKKDTAFYVASAESAVFKDSLETTLAGGTGCAGEIMFKIKPKSNITLDSLRTLAQNLTQQKIYIYFKTGGMLGYKKNKASWKLLDSVTVKPLSTSNPFGVKLSKLPLLKKDSLYSIYLNYFAIYTKGVARFENNDLTVYKGTGLCSLFNNVTSDRIFNGKLFYSKNSYCESSRAKIQIKATFEKIDLGFDTAYCENQGTNYLLDAGVVVSSPINGQLEKAHSLLKL